MMRSTRLKITHLITKIKEVLPIGDDIYGYAGVSKQMLIESLRDSYALLACFDEYNSTFEVIFMKRNIASSVDWCYAFFKDNINAENFNYFLQKLNEIRTEIKITYILVSQNPLRLDSEIAEAKESLANLKSSLNEISEVKEEIITIQDECKTIIDILSKENNQANENNTKISDLLNNFKEASERVTTISANIEDWNDSIATCESNIKEYKDKIVELSEELSKTKELFQEQQLGIDSQLAKQKVIITNNEEHQKEIKATLEGANKHGLAGSFYTRKCELGRSLILWGSGAIISIILLLGVSYYLVKPVIDNPESFSTITYLARIPVFGALVWLGWFCTKQYGYSTRIREEYAFKYAISMAFEGYKKEALEVNEELLDNLLKLTLNSISISPAHCYDSKTNHGTPVNEIAENVLKEIKPFVTDIAKKTFNN